MIALSVADLTAQFRPGTLAKARAYLSAGAVQSIEDDGNGLISSVVRGSGGLRYAQDIQLVRHLGRATVRGVGECSCPVGIDCKHIAAVLLAVATGRGPRGGPVRTAPAAQPSLAMVAPPPVDEVPPQIADWFRQLERAGKVETEEYPTAIRRRLIYLLGVWPRGVPSLVLQSIEVKRDGSVSPHATAYRVEQLTGANPPQFLRPSDRPILRRLRGFGGPESDAEEFIETLRQIVATGRGRWQTLDGPALTLGTPRTAALAWRVQNDGSQTPMLDLPAPLLLLRLAAPWYVDTVTGAVGPVETAFPAAVVRAVLDAPVVPQAASVAVANALAQRFPAAAIPAPTAVPPPKTLRAPFRPTLHLTVAELPHDPLAYGPGWRRNGAHLPLPRRFPLAQLRSGYGPVVLGPKDPATQMHEGALLAVVRDTTGENRAVERLRSHGLRRLGELTWQLASHAEAASYCMASEKRDAAWIVFMMRDVQALRLEGWDVTVSDDFPFRIAEADGPVTVQLRPPSGPPLEAGGIDWLELELGVMVNGVQFDLAQPLMEMLSSKERSARLLASVRSLETDSDAPRRVSPPLLLPLQDGRLVAVAMDRILPILAPLLELFAARAGRGGPLHVSRQDAADLAAMEAAGAAAGMVWKGGDAIRSLGRQLRDAGGIPAVTVPNTFAAELRPYQATGVNWLGFLREAGLGGVLADDMGLGKTVQALAHLVVEQAAGRLDRPCLVVCPTSLAPNWRAEAQRFAPTLRVLVLHGPDRRALFPAIPAHDLVITTYPLLSRDHGTLAEQDWHVVMLDEAQTIKNPAATTSKLARTLKARQRLCLSGTPLENHLGELWSLFDFAMPGFLGNQKSFGSTYRTPIEKEGDTDRRATLARRVGPFLLRRTKDVVAADLPPKTDIAEAVEMAEAQRGLYDSIRLAMHAKVQAAIASRGLAQSGIVILEALLKLRQTCCDPRLLKMKTVKATRAGSAKLERLMDMLPTMLEEGCRVLLFSQFTSMLALIQQELEGRALPFELLTGDTRDRATPVRRFQSGQANLFLISLKAGGVGLNLTAADTVIHYDPWWNPAVEDQATDRAHRIGQDKPVFVHRLITVGSIEEKIVLLKARKQALVDGILCAGTGATLGITEADLEDLFAPAG